MGDWSQWRPKRPLTSRQLQLKDLNCPQPRLCHHHGWGLRQSMKLSPTHACKFTTILKRLGNGKLTIAIFPTTTPIPFCGRDNYHVILEERQFWSLQLDLQLQPALLTQGQRGLQHGMGYHRVPEPALLPGGCSGELLLVCLLLRAEYGVSVGPLQVSRSATHRRQRRTRPLQWH